MLNPEDFGAYLQDILAQPQAVRDTIGRTSAQSVPEEYPEQLKTGAIEQVVLTGMGASYHALYPLTLELVAHGIRAQRIETSELLYYAPRLLHARTLVLAVSQSGQSVEIVKLLERQRAQKFALLGVTNTAESPLATAANAVVLTHAGPEFSVSSKTYAATLAALELLGAALTRRDVDARRAELEQGAAAMAQYLAHWDAHVSELMERLKGIEHIAIVGRGPSLAAVGTGALIQREAAHVGAQDMSSSAFRHGPIEMVSPQMFVLVFRGIAPTVEQNEQLAKDIRAAGGQAELVQEGGGGTAFGLPPAPESTLPMREILVPQMMSLALARRKGRIPGNFERIAKITTVE